MVLRLSVGSFPRDMESLEHLPVFQTPTFLDCEKETKKFEKRSAETENPLKLKHLCLKFPETRTRRGEQTG